MRRQSRSSNTLNSLFAAAALLLCFAGLAKVQAGAKGPPDSDAMLLKCHQLPACKAHLERGDRLSEQNQYSAALDEYQAAYQLQPCPKFLYNIARFHHKQQHLTEAIEYYQRYLNSQDTERVELARQHLTLAQDELAKKEQAARPQPAATPTVPLQVAKKTPDAGRTPVYKKWWFWTIIGGVVVAGGVAGVVAATYPRPSVVPPDAPRFQPF